MYKKLIVFVLFVSGIVFAVSAQEIPKGLTVFNNLVPPQTGAAGTGLYHSNINTDWTIIPGSGGCLFWKASVDPFIVNFDDDLAGGCNFQSTIFIENRCASEIAYTITTTVGTSTCNCAMGKKSFSQCSPPFPLVRRSTLPAASTLNGFYQDKFGGKFHQIITPPLATVTTITPTPPLTTTNPDLVTNFHKQYDDINNSINPPDCASIKSIKDNMDEVLDKVEKIIKGQPNIPIELEDFLTKSFDANVKLIRNAFNALCSDLNDKKFGIVRSDCTEIHICSKCSGRGWERCNCTIDGKYETDDNGNIIYEKNYTSKGPTLVAVDVAKKCDVYIHFGNYKPCSDCIGLGYICCQNRNLGYYGWPYKKTEQK